MVLECLIAIILILLLVVVPSRGVRSVLALLLVVGAVLNYSPGLVCSFRREVWAKSTRLPRRIMAYDFLTRVPFVGKTRAELQALLGKESAERDLWMYNLSAPTSTPTTSAPPQLLVSFELDKASKVFITDGWRPPEGQTAFDETQWRGANAETRATMIADLFRGPFVASTAGQTKQQIAARLGQPDKRTEAKTIEYDLGMFPWLGEISGTSLVFLLSENDVVLSGSVVHHPYQYRE